MPRYPKWVTAPRHETQTYRFDPQAGTPAEIAQSLREYADVIEKMATEHNIDFLSFGEQGYCDAYCGDYCYSDHVTGRSLVIEAQVAVPLTEEQLAANIKRYENEKALNKAAKAKREADRKKQLTRMLKNNKALAKEILEELEN